MTDKTYARLFDYSQAFADPITTTVTLILAGVLVLVPCIFWFLSWRGRIVEPLRTELWRRYYSWLILIPLLSVPVLLGAFWTIVGFGILSLFCYREYARAVGLFREKLLSFLITLGIIVITFAVLDHWYNFFMALTPLTIALLVAAANLADEPKGYIQRVALSVLAFGLFGTCMGHIGYMANDVDYRPRVVLLLLSVEANDVFAFLVGKTLGHRKLVPNTSPNKTVAGAVGALVLTTVLVMVLGRFVYADTALESWPLLALLGALISVSGQMGDLALSSIKRDLGLKDMGVLIPGHGGLLDRFDSILLAAPAYFHFVGYFVGFGIADGDQTRIFTNR